MALRRAQDLGYASGATHDAAFKTYFEGKAQTQMTDFNPMLKWLKGEGCKKVMAKGDEIKFNIVTQRGSGFGPRGEMDVLPAADSVTSVKGTVNYRKGFKGRLSLSAEAMKHGKKGDGAYVDFVKQEMDEGLRTMRDHASPALWGTGNGTLAKITAESATTVTVTSSELSDGMYPGTRWLHEGQKYVPVTHETNMTADGTWITPQSIASIDSDTQVTLDTSSGGLGTNPGYLKSADTVNSAGITIGTASSYTGPDGLLAMVDDGTLVSSYCGISESTYPIWKARISDGSGTARALTLQLIYQAYMKIARSMGRLNPRVVTWTNPDLYSNKLVDLLEHFVEFKPRKLDAGYDEVDIMINGNIVKIKLDFYAPGAFFFLNPEHMKMIEGCPLEVADEDGIWARLPDQDGYEARLRWEFNLYCNRRNGLGMLSDITYSVTSV
jgi:hypothetical protein